MRKKIIQLTLIVSVLFTYGPTFGQTCTPTPPVCVGVGNQPAFVYSANTNFRLQFNDGAGINQYQFTNGSGSRVMAVSAITGEISFGPNGALLVGTNKPAFLFEGDKDAGLFFTAGPPNQYQFRSLTGANVFTIDENDGDLTTTGRVFATGGNSGNWNTAYGWGNHATAGYLTTETDPQVGSISVNRIPRWNGTQLVTGSLYDNGLGHAGVGGLSSSFKWWVNLSTAETTPIGIQIDQNTSTVGSGYGMFVDMMANASTSGTRYGVYSDLDNSSFSPNNSSQYGYYTSVDPYGTGTKYGYFASLGGATGANSTRFGYYASVSSTGTGTHYGGFFAAQGSGNFAVYGSNSDIAGWAGYFTGRGYFGGNVGIGINNPVAPLHISTSASEMARFQSSASSRWLGFYDASNIRKGIIWNNLNDMILRADDANGRVLFQTAGNNYRMAITAAGNVGIGTLVPSAKLDVVGTSEFNGQADFNGDVFVNDRTIIIEATNANINIGGSRAVLANVIGDIATPTITVATGDEDLWIQDDIEVTSQGYKAGGGVWSAISDKRLKKDIQPYTDGLEQVLQINPKRFKYNNILENYDIDREFVGVIAQDMQEIAPYMVEEKALFQKIDENEDGTETVVDPGTDYLTYDGTALSYMLVNAIKEQQSIIERKSETIEQLTKKVSDLEGKVDEVEDLKSMMIEFEKSLSQCCINHRSDFIPINDEAVDGDAWLGQNIPNPFDNSTTIQYYTPEQVTESMIIVYSIDGKEVKKFELEKGFGQVRFTENDLTAGTYVYTMVNDGTIVNTKKMILKK